MQAVGDSLKRVRRGFLFGFSAAVGAWVALAVLAVLVHSIR
jgi:hypothetical protein